MNPTGLEALQLQLHRVIEHRCQEFKIPAPLALPDLQLPLPTVDEKAWLPVDGMYGGFAYWRDDDLAEAALTVESWCRVVEGSGQRHLVLPTGYTLLKESIC